MDPTGILFGFAVGCISTYTALLTYTRTVGASASPRPARMTAGQFGKVERIAVSEMVVAKDVPPRPIGYIPNQVRLTSDWTRTSHKPDNRLEQAYSFRIEVAGEVEARKVLIPGRYLVRFISLDKPAKRFWYGKDAAYSDCLLVARAHEWVIEDPAVANGWTWPPHMRTLGRRVRQLESEDIRLPSPARVGEETGT